MKPKTLILMLVAVGCGRGGSDVLRVAPESVVIRLGISGPGSLEASGLPLDCHAGC